MAIPPYISERLTEHFAQSGDEDSLKNQLKSNETVGQARDFLGPLTIVATYPAEGKEIRILRHNKNSRIEARIINPDGKTIAVIPANSIVVNMNSSSEKLREKFNCALHFSDIDRTTQDKILKSINQGRMDIEILSYKDIRDREVVSLKVYDSCPKDFIRKSVRESTDNS